MASHAIHLRYDWDMNDIPSVCVCGDVRVTSTMPWSAGVGASSYNVIMKSAILTLKCSIWSAMTLKWNQSYKKSLGRCCPECVNKAPDPRLDIHARGLAFGIDKVLPFSTWGFVTPTQNRYKNEVFVLVTQRSNNPFQPDSSLKK